ncbi:heptaprenyl diphosphate synthase component 1 [Salisediminibacterium beveridgei]|uniref:Heptaprenyl diphosphate synthase component I n=1 Tax=Salisediminibacterium beveridgei TaxID=632773 RepID=A0A1D7QUV6_9BACI|nr:heptaprenyl diphosphate synthase component 1 [Salisediminibacterium beveridgei]AOM82800.1 Heptaprenyl diphosphate synthase component I [Salisediminibacterium beveridgei]
MVLKHQDVSFIQKVMSSFYKAVDHRYLKQFLGDPELHPNVISVLLYLFDDSEGEYEDIHDGILTSILVQKALDTHEQINQHGIGIENLRTKRQLTVLAGDYYSSLYYYILSRSKNELLMYHLSLGIQQVNEAKMVIYQHDKKARKPVFEDLRKVFTGIAESLAKAYDLTSRFTPVGDYLLLMALKDEEKRYHQEGNSLISAYIEKTMISSAEVKSIEEGFQSIREQLLLNLEQEIPDYAEFCAYIGMNSSEWGYHKSYCNSYAMEEG